MRRPSQHSLLELDNDKGLSTTIVDDAEEPWPVKSIPGYNVDVICSGPKPPNTALLLASGVDVIIEQARRKYDNIIFDAPPVLGMQDSPILSNLVEEIVFVVEAGQRKKDVQNALSRLLGDRKNFGCILSKYEPADSKFYYGYSYGYAYESAPENVASDRDK